MIRANFSAYASYVVDSLYQWDLNQVLSVTGLNLAVAPEVHFSNANMDRAIVRQATTINNVISVGIPNSLLQEPLRIRAHIGIYEGGAFKVVEVVEIPVIARKRPNDYQIQGSDEEIYSFKALENEIANMVKVSDFNTDKASINARISTVETSVNARIDNIIAHNNDTEGNTELVDIRVGADNQTYRSAGEAIRKQLSKIQGDKAIKLYNMALYIDFNTRLITLKTIDTTVLSAIFCEKFRYHKSNGELNVSLSFAELTTNTYNIVFNAKTETLSLKITEPSTGLIPSYEDKDIILFSAFMTATNIRDYIYIPIGDVYVDGVKYANSKPTKRRLSILGDSYSTYGGFMTPDTNRCFYNGENTANDVTDVSQMWWYKLIEERGYLFEVNNSHSGSPICNTGYDGADASGFSFIGRMNNIGRPDVIAVFGGTNDAWAGVPIGEYMYANWTSDDLKSFRPAFAYMCDYLIKHNPNADIYIIVNSGLSTAVTESMNVIGNYYGLSLITLPTFDKPYDNHPSKNGQAAIFEAVKDIVV